MVLNYNCFCILKIGYNSIAETQLTYAILEHYKYIKTYLNENKNIQY